MASTIRPLKLWGKHGPNPPKVAMMLEELSVPYETIDIALADVKKPEYLAVNPNGRLPAIEDPNTGLTLWESGAIVEYLIEKYDTAHKLSFPAGSKEAYLAKQWLYFQASGQGPYFGQAVWFTKYHPERLPSAAERYTKEIGRVSGVLEGHLAKQSKGNDGPWLVGGKCSYADIAFFSWQNGIQKPIGKEDYDIDNYPVVKEWLQRLRERRAVKKVVESQ